MTTVDKKTVDKKKGNFLDLIPEHSCRWEASENENEGTGGVDLLVPRFKNKWMKKFAMKLGKSELVKVHLDDMGAKVWNLMDGVNNVSQIGNLLAAGEEKTEEQTDEEFMDQVFGRLTQYLTILERNKFITFKNLQK